MNARPPRTFKATGTGGYSAVVLEDPGHVRATKRETAVSVRFAKERGPVLTREGIVQAEAADAIITGVHGERWPVSAEKFGDKYQALEPTQHGESGVYLTLPNEVLAIRIGEPFAVVLSDGQSTLAGSPGDWLVDYGDGSFGIVAADIFAQTYEIRERA